MRMGYKHRFDTNGQHDLFLLQMGYSASKIITFLQFL